MNELDKAVKARLTAIDRELDRAAGKQVDWYVPTTEEIERPLVQNLWYQARLHLIAEGWHPRVVWRETAPPSDLPSPAYAGSVNEPQWTLGAGSFGGSGVYGYTLHGAGRNVVLRGPSGEARMLTPQQRDQLLNEIARRLQTQAVSMRQVVWEVLEPALRQVVQAVSRAFDQMRDAGLMPEPESTDPRQRALDARRYRDTGPQDRPGGRYGRAPRDDDPEY